MGRTWKMTTRFKSRLFRRMVLSYFAILLVPITVFSALFITQTWRENRQWEQNVYESGLSGGAGVVDQKFFDINSLGDRLLTAGWIERVRSNSEIITRYFDATRRSDVCQELAVHKASIGIAGDLVVLLPAKDQAVSPAGWGSMAEILSIAGIKTQAGREALDALIANRSRFQVVNSGACGVIPGTDDLLVLQSLDMLNNSRAFLFLRIEKTSMDEYLNRANLSDVLELSLVSADGETLYCYQPSREGETGFEGSISSQLFPWSYAIRLKKAQPSGQFEQISAALLAVILTLALGFLAAYLLAAVSYRPIRNLVNRIGGDRQESEFQTISGELDRLTAEQEKLNALVEQYRSSARNNLLFSLLHGCFDGRELQGQLDEFRIPYTDGEYYTVQVFRCPAARGEKRFTLFLHIQAALLVEKAPFDLMETLDEDIVAILHFPSPGGRRTAKELAEKLPRYVREKMNVELQVSCGTEERGVLGISKSYQSAKERIDSLQFAGGGAARLPASRCYYPTDWEMQFVNNLKLGNTDPALKILQELRLENDRRELSPAQQMKLVSMIFDTILRLMDELEMDTAGPAAFFEEDFAQANGEKQWEYLADLTRKICGRTAYRSGRGESAGEKLLRYVDANFENPDLSLQVLADQMDLSVSAISRIFKATVKINFVDYLCRIRMEKAKEYLRVSEAPIAEVSRQVGYENELSFKRAFIRYEGIRPREYRQQQREKAGK